MRKIGMTYKQIDENHGVITFISPARCTKCHKKPKSNLHWMGARDFLCFDCWWKLEGHTIAPILNDIGFQMN